jgi:hypothetical protein
VILHSEQNDSAKELIRRGQQAKAAVPAMIQSLTSTDATTRYWSVRVLLAIGAGSPEVVPTLVRELQDKATGYEAADALIAFSVNDTSVLASVIAELPDNPQPLRAENSVRVLDGIGPDASASVPALIRLLNQGIACESVVGTLCNLGPDAAPAVLSLLRHYDRLRGDGPYAQGVWVIITLGRIGSAAKEAVPTLLDALGRYQVDAARALWRVDPRYAELAINVALGRIQQQNMIFWNAGAIALLGEIGPPAKRAVPLLLKGLASPPDQAIAFNIAWALWRIDPDQRATIIPVLEDLRHQPGSYYYPDMPLDAVGALWQIQPERRPELRPAVVAALRNGELKAAWAEMKTLQPAVNDILDDPNYADLRPAAVQAIRQFNRRGSERWSR